MSSPFHATNTPEALLGRNDSKNPSTTCKGIISSGRPCRRALVSPKSSPFGKRRTGVVAVTEEDGHVQEADFYCWQHKDQAQQPAPADEGTSNGRRVTKRSTELYPVERNSIDTLVQRLGIESVPEEGKSKPRKQRREPKAPRKTDTHDFATSKPQRPSHPEKLGSQQPPRRPKKKPRFFESLCCMGGGGDEDYVEVVRHRKRVEQATNAPPQTHSTPAARPQSASTPPRRPLATELPTRPANHQRRTSSNTHTNELLSLIPPSLSPQTTSTLLAELIKPISPADEDGYIYIFWLTPQSKGSPAESAARSLLNPETGRPKHERRISDVMTEFSFAGSEPDTRGKKTIMLKIGRANNVTRRMNEWKRQCGYELNIVRFYPYVPSASSATPSPQPSPSRPLYPDPSRSPPASRRESGLVRKVPFVKRVERLIHLEQQEQQVKRQCAACGKEHREWFEVEASQAGVKAVDECVKRWVGWAEREAEKR